MRGSASVSAMLRTIAEGVLIHESDWCQSNSVVVRGRAGALVIDPGIHDFELAEIASDLNAAGDVVLAGFSTHPHWDHMLWHPDFGAAPRLATGLCESTARTRLAGGIDARRFGIPDDVPLELLGRISGLPDGATEVPWDGSVVRILEHRAHAPGHAALVIEDSGVLVAGDMLSDVFIPMLDLMGAADPIEDYLAALRLLEGAASDVSFVIPGHGSVGDSAQLLERIHQDRAYVEAVRNGRDPKDPRAASPKPGWEFVAEVHTRQVDRLAQLRDEAQR
jgi:glyoxylase-like metal-dependent hydrolase (beta-lactamase superfamily II)